MTLASPTQRTATSVSADLARHAAETPERAAVVTADGRTTTFGRLEARVVRLAAALADLGLGRADRVCLFVQPGPDLIALTHALFRIGAVPVLIDPGMGRRNLLACVERMQPRGLIGVPRAHVARLLFPRAFRSVDLLVTVGRRLGWGGVSLRDLERSDPAPIEDLAIGAEDEAAILFTSGSTGPPKGVTYTHGNLRAQLEALRELYDLRPGEVDVVCFPLFALFDNALGMTSVFPSIDPARPAACDPAGLFETIERSGATFSFGSPAIWQRVLPWLESEGRRFSTLRRVTIAGAPVPPALVAGLRERLAEGGEVHTPYGATESLPVTSAAGAELVALRERVESGEGSCIGRVAPGAEVALIEVSDEAIATWDEARRVPQGVPGEICVRSAATTREYSREPGATALAKIDDASGGLWHRMGDVGRLDPEGRLWFLGRKSHRIETATGTLYPVPIENAFLDLAGVQRTALVGVGPRGGEQPVLLVEPTEGASHPEALAVIERRRSAKPVAAPITEVRLHPGFPVDVRHNAKINRLALKAWAEGRQ